MTWHFVILRDSDDRVHLGAMVAGTPVTPSEYFELLGQVGAGGSEIADPCQTANEVVIVAGEQLAELQGLVERCIDDERLRTALAGLLELQQSLGVSRIDLADPA